MGKKYIVVIIWIILTLISCRNDRLINDPDYLQKVSNRFNERRELYNSREKELFAIIDQGLSVPEAEAIKFLFAYMPLSDIADYPGDFFLENARLSLKAKRETPWGEKIPEEIFLHYVLPPRVNNENLDSFRIAYYDEIHKRIGSLETITEASLEINHWCHEKVSYQPADIRTSSPMATILSARGRCGEESTFTVAAMRTAGIPARQIYTPRWAHSDDNHAWVEVWVDGEWKYLGACEPEPVLDRGWFTEPARRAMLTHTKAFGLYRGNEDLVKMAENYAEVNTLSKYARTKTLVIKVVDRDGIPVEDATVEPRLYNYAEFYPLTEIYTGNDGHCEFVTGLGDLLVWAYKGDNFGFKKINVAAIDTLSVSLGDQSTIDDYYEFDFIPPVKHVPYKDTVPEEMIRRNAGRLRVEDSIRHAYINTWMTDDEAIDLADKFELNTERVQSIIEKSMGNYGEIASFIQTASENYGEKVLDILEQVSDKDLRDTPSEIIYDHLSSVRDHQGGDLPEEVFNRYILNPRIANEILSPWRSYIREYFDEEQAGKFIENPSSVAEWINENIVLTDTENYYGVPISPAGILKTGFADELSRNILFVAICRSFSIPAEIKEGIEWPRYYNDGSWEDVFFGETLKDKPGDAFLTLTSPGREPVPEYYRHFTLARFENGRYLTLNYGYNKKITSFSKDFVLPEGEYMIVTGNRTNDSRVLNTLNFFQLRQGENKTVSFELRKDEKPPEILAKLPPGQEYMHGNESKLLGEESEQDLVLIWIEHDKEPSKHIMNDLPHVKRELDDLGCKIVVLSDPEAESASYDPSVFKGLPEKTVFGFDHDLAILRSVYGKRTEMLQWPVVLSSDANGNIYYMSEGYRIGIGEQILKSILNR